jgi:hypothetical protein
MRYAIIENSIVVNAVESEPDFAQTQGWVIQMPDTVCLGDTYENGMFSKPLRNLETEWQELRLARNLLLTESDINVLPDRWAAMTAEQQNAWSTYRQVLRDLPTTYPDPKNIVWPTKPE